MKSNRDRMKEAVEGHKAQKPQSKPAKKAVKVAAAATPEGPKKPNPRSAAARDARAKARGRLPNMVTVELAHCDGLWSGAMRINYWQPKDGGGRSLQSVIFTTRSKGQFETAEALDVLFWAWFVAAGDEPIKALLEFSKFDVKPEPYPKDVKDNHEPKA